MKQTVVTFDELGAWVLRCNPNKEGFGGMAELVDEGDVGNWTVPRRPHKRRS